MEVFIINLAIEKDSSAELISNIIFFGIFCFPKYNDVYARDNLVLKSIL